MKPQSSKTRAVTRAYSLPSLSILFFFFFPGGAGAQDPGGVTGSGLWYRADLQTSTITDGNRVTSWKDLSSGNQITQTAAAEEPVYYNDATNNINYNPVLYFNGNNFLEFGSATGLTTGSTARTVFAVALPSNVGTANQYVMSWGNPASDQEFTIGAQGSKGQFTNFNTNVNTANGFWQTTQPSLLMTTYAGGNNAALKLYENGMLQGASTNLTANTDLDYGLVGGNGIDIEGDLYANDLWQGNIAELIVFSSALSAANQNQVLSYLAIRYGLTLDQTTPANYTASNGTVLWNATTLATYSNNIAGVGRDNNEDQYQRQSSSVNAGFQIYMALGNAIATTNSANTSTIATDKSYVLWGDNAAATTFTRSVTVGATSYNTMPRTWIFERTNWTDANVTISQDSGALATYMLVATDAAFTNVTQQIALTGGSATLSSSKIPNGSLVTFANIIPLPVNLVAFSGQATKAGDVLTWQTAGEINNAYFAIERSTDGVTFDSIGRVNGQGNTVLTQDYTFTDSSPLYSYTNYYRLHQVDLDGYATNSYVVVLRPDGGPVTYLAYPNPAGATLHLSIPTQQSRLTLNVYTTSGIRVQNQVLESPGTGADLDVRRLATGIYFLVIMQPDGEQKTLSFLKQ